MKRSIIFYMVLFLMSSPVLTFSQEDNEEKENSINLYHKLDLSYIIGGQLYDDNFSYNPGYGFSISNGIVINKNVSIGLGIGGQFFEDEKFLPIYLDITAFKKNKKEKRINSFINCGLGYSIGWNNDVSNIENYEYHGGPYINLGIGRKTKIKKDFGLCFQISYRHQFAEIEYNTFGAKYYSKTLNYDMIVLTVGLSME